MNQHIHTLLYLDKLLNISAQHSAVQTCFTFFTEDPKRLRITPMTRRCPNNEYTLTRCFAILFTDFNDCLVNPCMNGATCNDELNGYTCTCVAGYTGDRCETGMLEYHDTRCCSSAASVTSHYDYLE